MEDFEIKVFGTLPFELKQQTDDLRYKAFHKETLTKDQKTENKEKFIFEEGCFKFVIALLDNKPIGYIRLFKRIIRTKEKEVILGGIGGVCTSPEEQRKGIATKMLNIAIDELKKAKCDIAYLCTDITKLGKLYEKVGFLPLPHQYTFVGASGKKYYKENGMIAPINSKPIFEKVLKDEKPFDLEGMNW